VPAPDALSLIGRLGIAEQMKRKTTLVPSGYVAELVARGEVAIGAQQVSELMAVKGVDVSRCRPSSSTSSFSPPGWRRPPYRPPRWTPWSSFSPPPTQRQPTGRRGSIQRNRARNQSLRYHAAVRGESFSNG
jgi:hypothetical protein